MGKNSLTLKGVNELIASLTVAGKSADKAADECIKACGEVMREEMTSAMSKKDVSPDLIKRLPPNQTENSGNRYTVRVGYIQTDYDPANLSDYFKALFINVGTPRRTRGGHIKARQFISLARKNASKRIKTLKADALAEIIKGIE